MLLLAENARQLAARVSNRTRTPTFQVLVAVGGMLGGAALISRLALGIMLIVGCLLVGVDGLLRESPDRRSLSASHEDVLERYRRAR